MFHITVKINLQYNILSGHIVKKYLTRWQVINIQIRWQFSIVTATHTQYKPKWLNIHKYVVPTYSTNKLAVQLNLQYNFLNGHIVKKYLMKSLIHTNLLTVEKTNCNTGIIQTKMTQLQKPLKWELFLSIFWVHNSRPI